MLFSIDFQQHPQIHKQRLRYPSNCDQNVLKTKIKVKAKLLPVFLNLSGKMAKSTANIATLIKISIDPLEKISKKTLDTNLKYVINVVGL